MAEKEEIEAKVAEHKPDYLLVLLGINDLVWYDVDPPKFEVNLREFIANARRGNPRLAAAFGTVLETTRAVQEPEFALKVAGANDRLRTVVKELSTEQSPLYVAETAAEFVAEKHTWDGTHPNSNGEIRIAAAFADIMASAFGIGAPYPRPYPDVAQVAAEAKETID